MPRKTSMRQSPAPSVTISALARLRTASGEHWRTPRVSVSTYLTRNYWPFPAVAGRADLFARRVSKPGSAHQGNGAGVVIRNPLIGRSRRGRGICCGRASAFSVLRARRCASSVKRDFAHQLCADFKIPFPQAHVASNHPGGRKNSGESSTTVRHQNPLRSPTSPIHTILCETVEDTRAWLRHVNYAEGVFLQEYLDAPRPGTSRW